MGRTRSSERAQTIVEFVGTLPLIALAVAICLQALLCALALVFAQSAADRAARGMTRAQVVQQVPSGWRARAKVSVDQRTERATVTITPPSLLPGAGSRLRIQASSPLSETTS